MPNPKVFANPIVTQVALLKQFYAAEDYHQDFFAHHPDYPYIVINDMPNVLELRKQFPTLYKQ
jgi:peptide-methionine (S)-S-oxide reductase